MRAAAEAFGSAICATLVPGVGVELTLHSKDQMFIGVATLSRHLTGTERYCSGEVCIHGFQEYLR